MKNLKKLIDQADDSILDEIISKCESKMASPFKKEKTIVAVEAEPEVEVEKKEESASKLADLSPEDLEKLKELYASIKG